MVTEAFSKAEALRFGWETLKAHLVFILGVMLLIVALNALPEIGRWQTLETAPLLALVWTLCGYLVQMATQMGLVRISLRLVDGQQPRYGELFGDLPTFWRYVGANILFLLIILGGLLLLVIPGIIWSIKYQFAPFLIVDRNLGPERGLQGECANDGGRQKGDVSVLLIGFGNQPAGDDGLCHRPVYHPAGYHDRLFLRVSKTAGAQKDGGG